MDKPSQSSQVVENDIQNFYNSVGWKTEGNHTIDALLWEDNREIASAYVSRCRLRIKKYLPKSGETLLDAASGPIQYPEYLTYSESFKTRICVDLSVEALGQAKAKLGSQGKYLNCSILDIPLETSTCDATISLHTIYHIESASQELAVRQLLRVTKPGCPLLIVYSNPNRPSSVLAKIYRLVKSTLKQNGTPKREPLYFHAHPLSWWKNFAEEANIEIVTWRLLTAKLSRTLLPNNKFGLFMFRVMSFLEESFPRATLPFAAYPLIILKKRAES